MPKCASCQSTAFAAERQSLNDGFFTGYVPVVLVKCKRCGVVVSAQIDPQYQATLIAQEVGKVLRQATNAQQEPERTVPKASAKPQAEAISRQNDDSLPDMSRWRAVDRERFLRERAERKGEDSK